ncbi:MAG: DUF6090 family protein [Balneolaceae bacterium]|nr:DUF6090 family protein [Balneolaceae bacterium]
MITLFRRIREKLIQSGSLTKYLLYAVGEILLVVIGILIALQVNNWNEERKQSDQIRSAIRQIQTDLSNDVLRADAILSRYTIVDSLNKRVAANEMVWEDYLSTEMGDSTIWFNYWYTDFVISTISYEKFKDLADDPDPRFTSLGRQLDDLYVERRNNIEVYNQRIRNTVYENVDYIVDNKDWYYLWDSGAGVTDEMEDFFLSDPMYKNQAQKFTRDLLNLTVDAQNYRVYAIDLYHRINELIGEIDNDDDYMSYSLTDVELIRRYIGSYSLWIEGSDGMATDTLTIIQQDEILYLNDAEDPENRLYAHADQSLYRLEGNQLYSLENQNGQTVLRVRDQQDQYWVKIDS